MQRIENTATSATEITNGSVGDDIPRLESFFGETVDSAISFCPVPPSECDCVRISVEQPALGRQLGHVVACVNTCRDAPQPRAHAPLCRLLRAVLERGYSKFTHTRSDGGRDLVEIIQCSE